MQYQTRFSRKAKRITIKVEYPQQIIVSAPKRTPKKIIDKFVKQQQAWIQQQLKRLKQKSLLIESEDHLLIFGKKYQKINQFQPKHPIGVFIQQDQLLLNFPQEMEKNDVAQELSLFIKKTGRTYLKKRVEQLAGKMKVEYNRLTLRNQKTRWGSCSGQQNLSLNWRLIHYAPKLIDYVIIHELAHLKQHNHSRQFWQLVKQFDSNYKQHRTQLKKQGVTFN